MSFPARQIISTLRVAMVNSELQQQKAKMRAAIALESYAEILAHILHFQAADKAEVLKRFGLSEDEFGLLDSAWNDELALGMKRQQRDQALRFSSTLAKHRKRLLEQMPSVESIGRPMPMPVEEAPAAPEPKPAMESPVVFRAMGSASLDSSVHSPWTAHASAPVAVAAIAASAPAPAPVVAAPAPVAAAPAPVPGQGQTADISAFVPRELLPFQPAPPTPVPAAPMPAEIKGKRLIRFNPQTGQMLEQPIWVDIDEK